jgi:hypothetical protein
MTNTVIFTDKIAGCHYMPLHATSLFLLEKSLERVKGIEPSYSAWEAAALPLSYTRADLRV